MAAASRRTLAIGLIVGGALCCGCQPAFVVPSADLVITTSAPEGRFDLRRITLDKGQPRVAEQFDAGPLEEPPAPVLFTRDGMLVIDAVDPRGGARTLHWLPPDGSIVQSPTIDTTHDRILDTAGGRILLARRLRRRETPAMQVDRGVIRKFSPHWLVLSVCDADARSTAAPLEAAVLPVARVADTRWLVITRSTHPELVLLDWATGDSRSVAPWPADCRFAGVVVAPDGQWAALGSQRAGQRWNLFDIHVWRQADDSLSELTKGVFVATRPHSAVGPALVMEAVDAEHLAFVTTIVDSWRDTLPVDGSYHTVIANVTTGTNLFRIRHPRPGLLDEVPPPHLPERRLSALRIQRARATPEAGRDDERWRRFLQFRDGMLVTAGGTRYRPGELGLYAYTVDGRAVAFRHRPGGGPAADACIVLVDRNELAPISIPSVRGLKWVPRR